MPGLEILSKVLSVYKADTSDAKRKVRELRGEEKKRAKAMLDGLERQNAGLDKQIAKWAKMGTAIVAVGAAYKTMDASAEFYAKRQQLRHAAMGYNIQQMVQASHHLLSTQEALQTAAAINNTNFKLTNSQLQTVVKAMVELRREGNNFQSVIQMVTQSVVEANPEVLAKFGVNLKASAHTAKGAKAVFQALSDVAAQLPKNFELAGDALLEAQHREKDAIDSLKESFGKFSQGALVPIAHLVGIIVEGMNDMVRIGKDIGTIPHDVVQRHNVKHATDSWGFGAYLQWIKGEGRIAQWMAQNHPLVHGRRMISYGGSAGTSVASHGPGPLGSAIGNLSGEVGHLLGRGVGAGLTKRERKLLASLNAPMAKYNTKLSDLQELLAQNYITRKQYDAALEAMQKKVGHGGGGGGAIVISVDYTHPGGARFVSSSLGALPAHHLAAVTGALSPAAYSGGGAGVAARAQAESMASTLVGHIQQGGAAHRKSMLAQIFGPPEEFHAYRRLFQDLSGVVTTAFDAWIRGQESLGTAIQQSIGKAIEAEALHMQILALKAFGTGIWDAAHGDPQATGDFLAAAKWEAGAIAAGAAAKLLLSGSGGSGGGGSGGSASPAAPASPGGSARPQNVSQTFIVNDLGGSFLDRRRNMRRIVSQAQRAQGSGTFEFS